MSSLVLPDPAREQPDWSSLYEIAAGQEGYFTTAQAIAAGYSPQLLHHHRQRGRLERARRGIYRLVHFPAQEHEDLVVLWLWSEAEGVFSHETALFLQQLSDALPARAHLTLPSSWRSRRLRVPTGVIPYYSDLRAEEIGWVGCLRVTRPLRTLTDCLTDHVQPDLIRQAVSDALERGLLTSREVRQFLRRLGR